MPEKSIDPRKAAALLQETLATVERLYPVVSGERWYSELIGEVQNRLHWIQDDLKRKEVKHG